VSPALENFSVNKSIKRNSGNVTEISKSQLKR